MACRQPDAGSCGALWKRKGKKRKTAKSQTPGKQKAENCQASHLDKYMCAHNRSWKHPEYEAWCEKVDAKLHGGR